MKTTDKKFDAVKYMREQRQNLSEKLSKMSTAEVVEYFRQKKNEIAVKPWHNYTYYITALFAQVACKGVGTIAHVACSL